MKTDRIYVLSSVDSYFLNYQDVKDRKGFYFSWGLGGLLRHM